MLAKAHAQIAEVTVQLQPGNRPSVQAKASACRSAAFMQADVHLHRENTPTCTVTAAQRAKRLPTSSMGNGRVVLLHVIRSCHLS